MKSLEQHYYDQVCDLEEKLLMAKGSIKLKDLEIGKLKSYIQELEYNIKNSKKDIVIVDDNNGSDNLLKKVLKTLKQEYEELKEAFRQSQEEKSILYNKVQSFEHFNSEITKQKWIDLKNEKRLYKKFYEMYKHIDTDFTEKFKHLIDE